MDSAAAALFNCVELGAWRFGVDANSLGAVRFRDVCGTRFGVCVGSSGAARFRETRG